MKDSTCSYVPMSIHAMPMHAWIRCFSIVFLISKFYLIFSDVGVQSLCTDQRQAMFYISAHTGVIYDYATRTQQVLQVLLLVAVVVLDIYW